MIDTATPQELERRKALRLRLRRDLAVEAQKYEGRTFYVLKDPVSLAHCSLPRRNRNPAAGTDRSAILPLGQDARA